MIPGVVLFDLDGTVTESGTGITRSVAYALKQQGIEEHDQAKLNLFIGPPLLQSFQKLYGFTEEQARRGVVDYRVYYEKKGMFENSVYDGVVPMLRALHAAGRRCILATAKPEFYAVQILEHFGLADYFEAACGATMGETCTEKPEIIANALKKAGTTQAVMVGDREHDILGARANHIPAIGVLYGYGSREELEAAGADWLAETPAAVARLLLE